LSLREQSFAWGGTADLQALTTAMANGEIDLLLISGANPAFTAPPQFIWPTPPSA